MHALGRAIKRLMNRVLANIIGVKKVKLIQYNMGC